MSDLKFTLEDISTNPHKYGAPTFDEFAKAPDNWVVRDDHILASTDKGSQSLKNLITRHKYEVKSGDKIFKAKTLDDVDRICRNEGMNLKKMKASPELCQDKEGKLEMRVRFEFDYAKYALVR